MSKLTKPEQNNSDISKSDQNRVNLTKFVPDVGIQIENDFGQEPIAFAYLCSTQVTLTFGAVASLLALGMGGPVSALAVAAITLNDTVYSFKNSASPNGASAKGVTNPVTASESSVGVQTQLEAIDVPGQSVDTSDGLPVRKDWEAILNHLFTTKLNDGTYKYSCVFIVAPQGYGKTTLLRYLVSIMDGRKVVMDAHYEYGDWQGCEVFGKGGDYEEIETCLGHTLVEVKKRLKARATTPKDQLNFQPLTVVMEEMTNLSDNLSDHKITTQFVKSSTSDFRKCRMRAISVAHSDTNNARGGAQGTSKQREQGEVRIELIAQGRAKISIPDKTQFILEFPDLSQHTKAVATDASPVDDILGDTTPSDTDLDNFDTVDVKAENVAKEVNLNGDLAVVFELIKSEPGITKQQLLNKNKLRNVPQRTATVAKYLTTLECLEHIEERNGGLFVV